ncbi:LRR receptor-like serine/threonine-protein kinase EFR [Coffea eugenioides]|uniref:LRR receptor-like serine/threonine-protein kinase EFR n=1 Tax=Coffea eugenioides TaxID=49369 RepID=UPI000F60710A|nr:LRR receptor-like serine/threonine-protein kinase EFR [Coffea eugenioides]
MHICIYFVFLSLLDIKGLIQGDPFQALSSWNDSIHFCDWRGVTCGQLRQRVTVLNMSSFHLVGSLSPSIGNLTFLRENIQDNNFHSTIPEKVGRLFRLQYLRFANNSFEGELPLNITDCSELSILDLRGNRLIGGIRDDLSTLSKLYALSLSRNNFSGSIPPSMGIIPDSVGKLVKMQELYLSENSFTGEIPSTIGDISELQILVLEQNMLTGNIPVSLSNCSNLQGFTVSQNRLSGALPKELLALSSLSLGLLLAQNQFTGSLPSEVGNMKNLVSLDISENKLSGEIPTSIDGCEMLEYLRLKGQIPASLAKLNFISTLNLSYNMLEGEVPMDGIFANSSALSALGNGKLCGGIKALNLSSCPKPTKKKAKLATRITKKLKTTITFYLCSRKQNQKLSYAELYDSTNGFSSENLIGEGKYGSVYKGVLKPGEQMLLLLRFLSSTNMVPIRASWLNVQH